MTSLTRGRFVFRPPIGSHTGVPASVLPRMSTLLGLSAALACASPPPPAPPPPPVAAPAIAAPPPATTTASAAGPARRRRGALQLEDVPETPAALRETLARYLAARRADVAGFDASTGGLFVLTRFGTTTQAHRVARPGGARTQLTFGEEPVDGWLPSVDPERPGAIVSMDHGGDENTQLYWLDLATRETTLLTDGRSRHDGPTLSDDGRRLAWVSTQRNGQDFDVWTLDLESPRASARLVLEVKGSFSIADWSPTGDRLLVIENVSETKKRLHVLAIGAGIVETIEPAGSAGLDVGFVDARFSAEGRAVFYVSDAGGEYRGLWRRDLAKKTDTPLTPELRWDLEDLVASPDRRTLAITVNEDGWSRVRLYDATKGRFLADPPLPKGLATRLVFSPDGRRLGFTFESSTTPGDAYVYDLNTRRVERWTESEVGGLDPARFHAPELVRVRSFDGLEVPCFVYRPDSARVAARGGRAPVLVSVHGGPEAQARPLFSAWIELLVRELGVAVVVPNVRGSTGYGRAYTLLDNGPKRMDAVKDLGAVLDWIAAEPGLDPARVGIMGGSYGGFMVLAAGYVFPERLRAIVDVVGISSFVTFLESTKAYRRELRRVEYGDERDPETRALLERISPLAHAEEIRAPLFVVQGANDPRVPKSEADRIVARVRARGTPVWYMLADDEGHGFQKKDNLDAYREAVVLFLTRTLAL
jgi:dipeptidyl aminopeptidase/acylaminoacyl peptidase